jgi:tetratricopeptide (TPR) repeat protein
MALQRNDVVVTRDGSLVLRFYSDGSQLRVGPNSRVQINESAGERDIEVFSGRLWARIVSWKERPVRFRTGRTIAAVRGTELAIEFADDTTVVSALEGKVQVENDDGSVMVGGGESVVSAPGKAPALQVVVRPQDAVRWAVYFQPVIYEISGEVVEEGAWQRAARLSTEAYRKGDLEGALELVGAVIDTEVSDSRFFTYRASLLLAASSVDKAAADIERSLELSPNDAQALALQTIIAVALNDNEKALSTADTAVSSDPGSATARIAQSYAKQAVFDLRGARDALEKAVELESDNALAWARLAELELSFGRLADALAAARTAAEYEPNLTRAQTVLGYAYLAQVRTGMAKDAFDKAIELDQGDPLPRLGLGLAKIRDGALVEGTKDIEVAASLDPDNSLVRSYLGKAYYEQKKGGLDGREFGLAKQFDPNDPTPWFYDAIAKQNTNRPVEALRDMEQAIDLNDNRAIYRSRLLLDSDEAARSASLGRIYGDLGFQQLGLVEGWSSVNTDPTNHSAHRLLADTYASQRRHEIARVSELFQSQMLQPLNTTPIQPRLAESNLFLISAQGPSALAFNEFNAMFNRDQVNALVSGSYGDDETWAGEAMVSGIYRRLSFSLGYERFETDGWRENSDQADEIGNAFLQLELGTRTSLQGEYRTRESETGDLEMRFWEGDYRPELRELTDQDTARIGLRHSFSPSSTLLLSFIHQDKTIDFSDGYDFLAGTLETQLDSEDTSDSFEGQFLFRSGGVHGAGIGGFSLIAGAGHFDIENESTLYALIDLPPPPWGPGPIPDFQEFSSTTKHDNLYAYANITLPADLTFTLGVSADRFDEEGGIGEKDQVNPKLGLTWRFGSGTTLRAAGFETLKRTLVTDQTLEPTQVAGFNQFYDDPSGTSAKVYGAAIDQKIGDSFFIGAQYTVRNVEIPAYFFDFETFELLLIDAEQDENLGRFYFFAAPHEMFTFSAEYDYEKIEHDPILQLGFEEVTTHRVPLGVQFIHPSGFTASVKGTFVDQEGSFELRAPPFGYAPGATDFWVLDLALRYRLPRRFGFISVGVNNATDEEFSYLATESILPSNARNLSLRPGRLVYAKVTLAFP